MGNLRDKLVATEKAKISKLALTPEDKYLSKLVLDEIVKYNARLDDPLVEHVVGTANLMYDTCAAIGLNPDFGYLLGILHDWGKILMDPKYIEATGKAFDITPFFDHPKDAYNFITSAKDLNDEELVTLIAENEDKNYSGRLADYAMRDIVVRHHTHQGKRSYPKELPETQLNFNDGTTNWWYSRLLTFCDSTDAIRRRKNSFVADQGYNSADEAVHKINSDIKNTLRCLCEAGILNLPAK